MEDRLRTLSQMQAEVRIADVSRYHFDSVKTRKVFEPAPVVEGVVLRKCNDMGIFLD
jgi:hypothetical protein